MLFGHVCGVQTRVRSKFGAGKHTQGGYYLEYIKLVYITKSMGEVRSHNWWQLVRDLWDVHVCRVRARARLKFGAGKYNYEKLALFRVHTTCVYM